jgi:hypothetical protein
MSHEGMQAYSPAEDSMNQKTVKLLKRLASAESKNPKEVRAWWRRELNKSQRAVERRRILTALE